MLEIIDKSYIDEFVGMAGATPFLEAIDLFEKSVNCYISESKNFFAQKMYEESAKEMHKIKGAASSIGLKRIMRDAKTNELEVLDKRENADIDAMIANFKSSISEDIIVLRRYVLTKQK